MNDQPDGISVSGAGPDAVEGQRRRVSSWYAQTHDLLDNFNVPRLAKEDEPRWLTLPERVRFLRAATERRVKDEYGYRAHEDSEGTETPNPGPAALLEQVEEELRKRAPGYERLQQMAARQNAPDREAYFTAFARANNWAADLLRSMREEAENG